MAERCFGAWEARFKIGWRIGLPRSIFIRMQQTVIKAEGQNVEKAQRTESIDFEADTSFDGLRFFFQHNNADKVAEGSNPAAQTLLIERGIIVADQ